MVKTKSSSSSTVGSSYIEPVQETNKVSILLRFAPYCSVFRIAPFCSVLLRIAPCSVLLRFAPFCSVLRFAPFRSYYSMLFVFYAASEYERVVIRNIKAC